MIIIDAEAIVAILWYLAALTWSYIIGTWIGLHWDAIRHLTWRLNILARRREERELAAWCERMARQPQVRDGLRACAEVIPRLGVTAAELTKSLNVLRGR